jgi:hypothetical protein
VAWKAASKTLEEVEGFADLTATHLTPAILKTFEDLTAAKLTTADLDALMQRHAPGAAQRRAVAK